jgi:hypothetical protein
MPNFSPAGNRADLARTERFLRKRKDRELIQVIAWPAALVDWLPGFEATHLRDADEHVAVNLAKNELSRRSAARALRASWVAVVISFVSVAAAIASAVAAWLAHR